MNELIMILALTSGQANNVDYRLVLAVMKVESNYNQNVVGSKGEIGLMQLMPSAFNVKPKELKKTSKNIHLGTRHLAEAKIRCKHKKKYTFLVCYNAGVKGGARIKNPSAFPYYVKVMKVFNDLKKILPPATEMAEIIDPINPVVLKDTGSDLASAK